ncbi:DUF262 domain-containing protein [Salegentibacter maritimus]|uniref:DUF262 domain-containing protein n=1 Tax=Salegentibacter maritimus TaxID=2794347 RepID=UPI0018E4B771|nr:DUF262 domain-containing protein [Salegentibacter maritimus]MBI6118363.1 DUF262 domain-containing protein [Salegentibacter maritimus]
MSAQIPAQPDKKTISDLIGKIQRKELILQPEFQREFVWTPSHMENFIKTILDGFPFPEIYISQKGIDLTTLATQNVVVDGQQRLTTIQRYIEGTDNFEKSIPKFADLGDQIQRDFLNYDVTIRDLKDISPEKIIEIFQRINSTNFTLTAIEINNAIYNGEFISCAKAILEKINEADHKVPIFSESELTRMADLHFILLVMSTLKEGGYFSQDSEVENYIAKFNDEFPDFQKFQDLISDTIINIVDSDLEPDSIWFRKSNFFTLVCELCFAEVKVDNLIKKLNAAEELILHHKNDDKETNQYALYYASMYAGTNSRTARVRRSEFIRKEIL